MSEIERLCLEAEGFARLGCQKQAQECIAKTEQCTLERKAATKSKKAAKQAEIKARTESVDVARFAAIAEIRRDFPNWKPQTVDRAAYTVMAGVPWARTKAMLRGRKFQQSLIYRIYAEVRSDEAVNRQKVATIESPQMSLFQPEACQGEENKLHIELEKIKLEGRS